MCPKIFKFGPKLVPHEEKESQSQFVPIYMAFFHVILLKSSLKAQYLRIEFSNRFFLRIASMKMFGLEVFSQIFVGVFRIGNFMESSHGQGKVRYPSQAF